MKDNSKDRASDDVVLVVDDDRAAANLLTKILKTEGYEILTAQGGEQALNILTRQKPDLVISDIRMPDVDGFAVLAETLKKYPGVPVILLTAFGDVDGAMEAIRKGAQDYLPKPYDILEVKAAVARALDQRRQSEAAAPAKQTSSARLSAIIGRSVAMLGVYKMVARIAPSDVSVLITGESGTGKELVARAIHAESERRDMPFVAVNCAGLAEGVLESELYGHEKGAFTGAINRRPGIFEQAHGGTLFLDEIGTISPRAQSQLLRVLQEGELRRVGGTEAIQLDVRVLSATNMALGDAAESGNFREDLFYRLNVVAMHLPPLRERREDIPLLAAHFLAKTRKNNLVIASDTMAILRQWNWPGNVRELENTVSRAVALSRGRVIIPQDLPPKLRAIRETSARTEESSLIDDRPSLDVLTKRYAHLILEESAGNKSKAAQHLGIDRKTLYRILSDGA